LPHTVQQKEIMGAQSNRFKTISKENVAYRNDKISSSDVSLNQRITQFPLVVFQTDKDGNYTFISKTWEKYSKIPVKEMLGTHITGAFSPEEKLRFKTGLNKQNPNSDYSFEFNVVHNGEKRKIKSEFNKLTDLNGVHTGFIGSFFDLTELQNTRNQLLDDKEILEAQEKKIKANLAELEIKNNELNKFISKNLEIENFAYIASHDLKAPLRSVMSFSLLLKKKYYDLLDLKGQKYLDIISDASQDMIRLIDGLLKYTTIHSSENNLKTVDISYLIDESLLTLQSCVEQSGATIDYGPMPEAMIVDKDKIYQLFYMLIDNSIKFRSPQRKPQIKIESEELIDHWLFKITDNGVGIPANFDQKAFELFKKVKTTGTDTGTGVGLTIAQTIVNQHDGKIWIESKEGEGMEVSFTIKKKLP